MLKQLGFLMLGTAVLIIFAIGINLAISLKLLLPANVIEWIGTSNNPRLALWLVSVLIASFLIILIKIGIKLPFLQAWVERPDHPLFSYLLALPLWAGLSLLVVSTIGLTLLGPKCQSPFANIEVVSATDETVEYDGRFITANLGSMVTLSATSGDNSVIFCSWSSIGSVIQSLGPQTSCTTQVRFSTEPGRGIITLTLSKSFCSVQSTRPIEIIVVP